MNYFWVLLWLGAAAAPSQAVECSALSQREWPQAAQLSHHTPSIQVTQVTQAAQTAQWRAAELVPLASNPAPASQHPPSGLKVSALQDALPASASSEKTDPTSWGAALGITALAMLVMAWRRGGR